MDITVCKNGETRMNFDFHGSSMCCTRVKEINLLNLLACLSFKFSWMNHKNKNVTCVYEINTIETRRPREQEEKKKKKRKRWNRYDTNGLVWSLCVVVFFFQHTCRQWVILICTQFELGEHWTHTRPYLVWQTRIKIFVDSNNLR